MQSVKTVFQVLNFSFPRSVVRSPTFSVMLGNGSEPWPCQPRGNGGEPLTPNSVLCCQHSGIPCFAF